MPNYPPYRNIEGAYATFFKLVFGSMVSAGSTYGLFTSGAFEAAAITAVLTAVMVHIARTMPLQEKLICTGAVYQKVPRSW